MMPTDRRKLNLKLNRTQAMLLELKRYPTVTDLLEDYSLHKKRQEEFRKSSRFDTISFVVVLFAAILTVAILFFKVGLFSLLVVPFVLAMWKFFAFRRWHRKNALVYGSETRSDLFDHPDVASILEKLEKDEVDAIDLEWAEFNYRLWWYRTFEDLVFERRKLEWMRQLI